MAAGRAAIDCLCVTNATGSSAREGGGRGPDGRYFGHCVGRDSAPSFVAFLIAPARLPRPSGAEAL